MRKKVLKIFLIIFIILAVIISALAIWQWKNIQSILLGLRVDTEEIQQLREENQTKLVNNVNEYMDKPLREMTKEEKDQLASGKVTINEIYQKMFEEKIKESEEKEGNISENSGEKAPGKNDETDKKEPVKEDDKTPDKNPPAETETPKPTKDMLISGAMVELYALQNEFNARAEATIKDGANYYESIKAHPQDANARSQTISHFTPTVRAIEIECDTKVEAVVQKLESDLKSIGEDTSIVGTIRTTYANEKQLKLSYYTNKYLK